MPAPAVTVIIPVHNAAASLQRCVDSILVQTYTRTEIILVNDGSTDTSATLCNTLAARHSNIRAIHTPNSGCAAARNTGLAHARGHYIIFLDSDDYWDSPTALARTVNAALAAPETADIVLFGCRVQRPDQSFAPPTIPTAVPQTFTGPHNMATLAMSVLRSGAGKGTGPHVPASACMALYSHKVIPPQGFTSEKIIGGEEILFKIRALLHSHTVVSLPIAPYRYTYNPAGITKTADPQRFSRFKILRDTLTPLFAGTPHPHAADLALVYAMTYIMHTLRITPGSSFRRRAILTRMGADPVWNTIAIDTHILTRRERLLLSLMRHHRTLILRALFSIWRRLR